MKQIKVKDLIKMFPEIDDAKKKYLLLHQQNWTLTDYVLNENNYINPTEFLKACPKLKKGIPVQYICHEAYFFSDAYYVDKNVLIPRPETEILVAETIKKIKNNPKPLKILEIGTGSGIIAITLQKKLNNAKITAIDISKKALKVAQKNQNIHKTNINFQRSNLFKKINEKYDVIISNPPYICKNSKLIEPQVKKYEPKKALFAREEGCYFYRKILEQVPNYLNENGLIAFEIGEDQADKIKEIAKQIFNQKSISTIEIKKDLNGFDRYFFINFKK